LECLAAGVVVETPAAALMAALVMARAEVVAAARIDRGD